jgi:hypothetical protein
MSNEGPQANQKKHEECEVQDSNLQLMKSRDESGNAVGMS